ncbi:hypothetical protein B0F90DRAFT_1918842 [Multifurca ochricompacta]|uniref:Uncharacterized protein n=1 Tax=Multifurca ochricompacta TaxID=376703 RepID=A0AAD4QJ31_9AGAM|nr:hypothetical protein B0F90DRAFT_1918842 [Multifurca ochricompacta]
MSTMVEDLSKVAQVLKGVRGDWEGGVKALLVFSKKGMACGEAHGSGAGLFSFTLSALNAFAIEWLDAESVFGVLLPEDDVLEPILTFSLGYGVLFILSELLSFKCCLVKHL